MSGLWIGQAAKRSSMRCGVCVHVHCRFLVRLNLLRFPLTTYVGFLHTRTDYNSAEFKSFLLTTQTLRPTEAWFTEPCRAYFSRGRQTTFNFRITLKRNVQSSNNRDHDFKRAWRLSERDTANINVESLFSETDKRATTLVCQ